MLHKDNVEKLIANYERRLQKLREKQALEGWSIDPKTLLEIEDIETEIAKLKTKSGNKKFPEHLKPKQSEQSSAKYRKHQSYDSTPSSTETKKNALQHRLEIKLEQVKELENQIDLTIDSSMKVILEKKAKVLWVEIERLEKELKSGPLRQDKEYDLGHQHLKNKSYNQAIKSFELVIERTGGTAYTYYYLALAMVGDKRPKLMRLSTIQTIENHLRTAIALNPDDCEYVYALWALIKQDYYVMNGISDHSKPTIQELCSLGQSISSNDANDIIFHIQASGNKVWEWLKSLTIRKESN